MKPKLISCELLSPNEITDVVIYQCWQVRRFNVFYRTLQDEETDQKRFFSMFRHDNCVLVVGKDESGDIRGFQGGFFSTHTNRFSAQEFILFKLEWAYLDQFHIWKSNENLDIQKKVLSRLAARFPQRKIYTFAELYLPGYMMLSTYLGKLWDLFSPDLPDMAREILLTQCRKHGGFDEETMLMYSSKKRQDRFTMDLSTIKSKAVSHYLEHNPDWMQGYSMGVVAELL